MTANYLTKSKAYELSKAASEARYPEAPSPDAHDGIWEAYWDLRAEIDEETGATAACREFVEAARLAGVDLYNP